MKTFFFNLSSFSLNAIHAAFFNNSTKHVRASQERVLISILKNNRDTEYGKTFDFSIINSIDEYRKKVPLIDYSKICQYIERISSGESNILFPGKPLCMQPTSGTTSKSKLIPFNAEIKKQFQRGVAAWNYDIYAKTLSLLKNKIYWSLSPVAMEKEKTSGKIPIGFLADTEYLTPIMSFFLKKAFAVPIEVGLIKDTDIFRYVTMAFLLKEKNLGFISIWNPTFFILLLDSLNNNYGDIIQDIERGEISGIKNLPASLKDALIKSFGKPNYKRAKELRSVLDSGIKNRRLPYSFFWPDLKFISCWGNAEASVPARQLQEIFPTVTIQFKGLIATEGFISFPLHAYKHPVLAVCSHFFEFIQINDESKVKCAWELENEQFYEVVLTTAAGLYRYKLGDIVKVKGFYNNCPMLEFIGRGNHVSDYYGEKLHQIHISQIISELFKEQNLFNYFALVAPEGKAKIDHYALFVAIDNKIDSAWFENLAVKLEKSLRSNFHYDYCRKLGQLNALEVCPLHFDVADAFKKYVEEKKRRGLREGDIKFSFLDNKSGWKEIFELL